MDVAAQCESQQLQQATWVSHSTGSMLRAVLHLMTWGTGMSMPGPTQVPSLWIDMLATSQEGALPAISYTQLCRHVQAQLLRKRQRDCAHCLGASLNEGLAVTL